VNWTASLGLLLVVLFFSNTASPLFEFRQNCFAQGRVKPVAVFF
jgi:hypothetical protein